MLQLHIYQPSPLLQSPSLICTEIEGGGKGWFWFMIMILMLVVVSICKAWISIVIDLPSPSWQQIVVFPVTQNRICMRGFWDSLWKGIRRRRCFRNWQGRKCIWYIFCEIYCLVVLFSFQLQRRRFKWENGSGLALGAALAATSGTPKTFQNLNVSSPAAVATVQPSGLCR